MSMTADETLEAFDHLSQDDQKDVFGQIAVRALGDPSADTTNNVWYIVVGTLAAVAVGGLIAVVVLVLKDKSVEVVAPFVTLALGALGGLLAPSPTQKGA